MSPPRARSMSRRPLLAPTLALLTLLVPAGCDTGPGATPNGDQAAAPATVDTQAFEAARNRAFRMHEGGADLLATREALLDAQALDPGAYGVNRRLGLVLTDLGMHADAVEAFRLALEARPDDLEVRQHLVALLAQLDRMDEALAVLPPLKDDPAYAGEALYLEANMADMAGDRERALALVGQADELEPFEGHRALALHGRFLFQAGDHAGALARFERSQLGRPDYKAALKGLADCHRRLGHEERAEHFETVLGLVLDLTDDEFVRKRKTLRLEKLSALLELLPEWALGYQQLADLHRREGRLDEACVVIERFLDHFPELVDAEGRAALRARYCGETP